MSHRGSIAASEDRARIRERREKERLTRLNARRYLALRAGNAYAPEEHYVRGGPELDALCDDLIAGRELKGSY